MLLAILAAAALLLLEWTRPGPPADPKNAPTPEFRVDLNRAPQRVLQALPGIGPGRAAAIVAEREIKAFRSLEDFETRVPGIGRVTAQNLSRYLRFEPAAPAGNAGTPE